MPDLWDTNPDNTKTAGEQPSPTASGHDHPRKVRLKDHRGHLRPPAYILIALVMLLVAVLLLLVGVMLAPI
jgi:hypothetical protein